MFLCFRSLKLAIANEGLVCFTEATLHQYLKDCARVAQGILTGRHSEKNH